MGGLDCFYVREEKTLTEHNSETYARRRRKFGLFDPFFQFLRPLLQRGPSRQGPAAAAAAKIDERKTNERRKDEAKSEKSEKY